MSLEEYQYELMRAELLGLPPPEKPDPKPKVDVECDDVEDTELDCDKQELSVQEETLNNASGGLDEINSILTVTQKKLNKFKVVCGSLTNLLKIKVAGGDKEEPSSSNCSSSRVSITSDTEKEKDVSIDSIPKDSTRKEDITHVGQEMDKSLSSQIDRLDSLMLKAEKAEMSMSHQNKQMRSFLR